MTGTDNQLEPDRSIQSCRRIRLPLQLQFQQPGAPYERSAQTELQASNAVGPNIHRGMRNRTHAATSRGDNTTTIRSLRVH